MVLPASQGDGGGHEAELQRRLGERVVTLRQQTVLVLVSRQTRENELGARPDPGDQGLPGASIATLDIIFLIFLVKVGCFSLDYLNNLLE